MLSIVSGEANSTSQQYRPGAWVEGDSMQIYEYKGYVIYPTPYYVACSKEWRIGVVVKNNNEFRKYSNNKLFSTEAEAVFNSIQFGKQLIDQGVVLLGIAV